MATSKKPTKKAAAEPKITASTPLSQLKVSDLQSIIAQLIAGNAGRAGSHVNSGPTGHANVPGHADFTKTTIGTKAGLPTKAGVHVNSGPTGHANVPGHADFTKATLGGKASLPGKAGSHVNSGPTGHANVPGHADFTKLNPKSKILKVTLPDGTLVNLPQGSKIG